LLVSCLDYSRPEKNIFYIFKKKNTHFLLKFSGTSAPCMGISDSSKVSVLG